jgi:hypothetical protein
LNIQFSSVFAGNHKQIITSPKTHCDHFGRSKSKANERKSMFDTMLNESIQRWEYEGGRVPAGGTGFITRDNSEKWFQRRSFKEFEKAEAKTKTQSQTQRSN